jgi:hypothetical protein
MQKGNISALRGANVAILPITEIKRGVIMATISKREVRNGVKKPLDMSGACGAVWRECDRMLALAGVAPTAKTVLASMAEYGFNENNVRIEVGQWRKFYGHSAGRVAVAPASVVTGDDSATLCDLGDSLLLAA